MKKNSETGIQFVQADYSIDLDGSALKISLSVEDESKIEKISYQLRQWYSWDLVEAKHEGCETLFNLPSFGEYYIKVILQSDDETKYSFNTEKIGFSALNAFESISKKEEKHYGWYEGIKNAYEADNDIKLKNKKMIERLAAVHALGLGLGDLLSDKGYASISVYVEANSHDVARVILPSLIACSKINVKGYYTNGAAFSFSNQTAYQLPSFMTINDSAASQISDKEPLLLLAAETPIWLKRRLNNLKIPYIEIIKLLPELLVYASFLKPLQVFRQNHPNLNIVVHNTPSLPAEKDASDGEREIYLHTSVKRATDIINGLRETPPKLVTKAFDEFNYETGEILEFLTGWQFNSIDSQGVVSSIDHSSMYCNLVQGHRLTANQPSNYDRTIWHFGYCHVWGNGAPDDKTMDSFLQGMLNEQGLKVRVENYGYSGISLNHSAVMKKVNSLSSYYQDNDIILIESFDGFPQGEDFYHLDIKNLFARPHDYGEIFIDSSHFNETGNRIVAKSIYDFICEKDLLNKDCVGESKSNLGKSAVNEKENDLLQGSELASLRLYLDDLARLRPRTGSIVMNCNPFTLGHRYLIEQAASKCTNLIIFVVEEDKSIFPFKDRIELVRKGTQDILNVTVIPSGGFIISSLTFSDYFGKTELQDKIIDTSLDLELFGRYIAPVLGITVRFAGEEPLDMVTKQYNDSMSRILPKYGIEFDVIPRKEEGGGVISASRVRALLETSNFDEIARIVPQTTLDYLRNM